MQPCSHQRLQIQFSLRCAHANTFCLASQGEDTDEVQNQPAWLREDAQDDQAPAENGGPPSLADLSLHQRNASAGAADYLGLGGAETPYANGDSHAQPGKRALATQIHPFVNFSSLVGSQRGKIFSLILDFGEH